MSNSQFDMAKAAHSRIWAIWVFYLFFNGVGAFIQALDSGEWAGFFTGWVAVILLSMPGHGMPSRGVIANRILLASIIGASVQTAVVLDKRRTLGISHPEEADEIMRSS